jgi:hypothetical protein
MITTVQIEMMRVVRNTLIDGYADLTPAEIDKLVEVGKVEYRAAFREEMRDLADASLISAGIVFDPEREEELRPILDEMGEDDDPVEMYLSVLAGAVWRLATAREE